MINQLQFLTAEEVDVPVIFAFAKDLIDSYEDLTQIDYDRVMSWMHRKIESDISAYTCVWYNSRKVAYYCLRGDNAAYELDDLYVLPEFQRQGIGSAILEKCLLETECPIRLYVFIKNTGAISLYRRHGFKLSEQISSTRIIMTCRT